MDLLSSRVPISPDIGAGFLSADRAVVTDALWPVASHSTLENCRRRTGSSAVAGIDAPLGVGLVDGSGATLRASVRSCCRLS